MNLMISRTFVNSSFKKNKQIILSSLLLIYYIVYAISPLYYTLNVRKIADRSVAADRTSVSFNNLNIFLLEVICLKIDPAEESDHADSTVRILIRKIRAILPEIVNVRFLLSENILVFDDFRLFFDNSSARRL